LDKSTGKRYAVTVRKAREILRAEGWSDDQINQAILRNKLPDQAEAHERWHEED
jgi:hypothetical protein